MQVSLPATTPCVKNLSAAHLFSQIFAVATGFELFFCPAKDVTKFDFSNFVQPTLGYEHFLSLWNRCKFYTVTKLGNFYFSVTRAANAKPYWHCGDLNLEPPDSRKNIFSLDRALNWQTWNWEASALTIWLLWHQPRVGRYLLLG